VASRKTDSGRGAAAGSGESGTGRSEARWSNARAVLDAAEELFCSRGYAAVSMRDIASAANAHLATANYHFGSKAGLFEAAFMRRCAPVNTRRVELLREYRAAGRTSLADTIEAYIRPLFETGPEEADPVRGARLIMLFSKQLLSNPDEHSYLQGFYDEVSRAFIGSIDEAVPSLSFADAVWGYNYMIGILVFTLAGRGMTARIPDEFLVRLPADEPLDVTTDRLVRFICAGIEAMAARPA
jgi:AcrR family transcriptional regulator